MRQQFDMTQEELFDKVFNCIHGCIDGTFFHCNIKDGVCRCDNCEYFEQNQGTMTRKEEREQASNLVFKIRLCPRTAIIDNIVCDLRKAMEE